MRPLARPPLRARMPQPRPDEGPQSPRREVIGLFKGRDLSGTCGIPRECDRVYVGGGRVSAEGPQRRCRCAQKAHMARRKELANKVNRPPRYARAGGVRQPRGEVRRVHGPHGRAQDDMASGRALVRRETQRRNRAPEEALKPLEAPPYQLCHENAPPIEKALVVQPLELDREGVLLAGALVGVVSELLLEPRHVVEWGVV